jgi:hypothetical protein
MRKLAFLAVVALALTACSGGSASDPTAAVTNVINAMKAKNFSSIPALICAARRDEISKKLDFASSMASNAPGLDRQAFLNAVTIDFQNLQVAKVSESGDKAVVSVKGKLVMTMDPAKARDLVKAMLTAGGQTPTDAQIDSTVQGMTAQFAKGTDIDSQGDVVKEGGAWLLCSDLT